MITGSSTVAGVVNKHVNIKHMRHEDQQIALECHPVVSRVLCFSLHALRGARDISFAQKQ